jgi:xylulokinase
MQEGIFTASLGTSGTLYAFSSTPIVDYQGEVAAFCDSTDHWLPLVCTMNVTVATEQMRKLFGWSVKEFDDAAASAPPGADGLLFLPYLTGERTPNLPQGTGGFHGMTTENTTPAHLARATLEGVTLGLAYGMERFKDLGLEAREVRLTGGGSKSTLWRQLAADVFGVQTVCLDTAEGAALGGAIQAGWSHPDNSASLAQIASRLVTLDESTRALPNSDSHALYKEQLSRLKALTRHLQSGGYL